MHSLLHIEASPRGDRSHSSRLAKSYIAAVKAVRPDTVVDHLNVWSEPLPEFSGALLSAKYAKLAGRDMLPEEAAAWEEIGRMVARIDQSDAVLISTPMWNLSPPYRLKHYIDLVTQPGISFSFNPTAGYLPLLTDRPAVVVLASSGDFSDGWSWERPDLATPYLKQALRFIGLTSAVVVPVGPTTGDPTQIAKANNAAEAMLTDLAGQFGITP
ncbi:FMN-dependent NADH-azoreductase [Mesorhizobium loti]|nr:FMN-dependent NADH-azoreductase [Mesorhizobium loti]